MVVVDVSENFGLWRNMNSLSKQRGFLAWCVCECRSRVDRGFEEKLARKKSNVRTHNVQIGTHRKLAAARTSTAYRSTDS